MLFLTGVTKFSLSTTIVFVPLDPGFLLYPCFYFVAISLIRLSEAPGFPSFCYRFKSLKVFVFSS